MNSNKLISNIQIQINNNVFKSKEDLYRYLLVLKQQGTNILLTEKDIEELLKLYDELHLQSEIPLSMENYSNKSINDRNFIVSESDDRILRTTGNSTDFIKEFKNTQNEIMAYKQDGTTNSQEVFNKIAETKKEELTLIPLYEAIRSQMIGQELLYKIKFFITRAQINPYAYKVDIETEIFYNGETNEVYEVRKNENTGEYEIYKGSELVYGSSESPALEEQNQELNNDPQLEHDTNEEQMSYESRYNKPKVRRLVPTDPNQYSNRAAFTKVGFLIINIVTFALLMTMIFLLNK